MPDQAVIDLELLREAARLHIAANTHLSRISKVLALRATTVRAATPPDLFEAEAMDCLFDTANAMAETSKALTAALDRAQPLVNVRHTVTEVSSVAHDGGFADAFARAVEAAAFQAPPHHPCRLDLRLKAYAAPAARITGMVYKPRTVDPVHPTFRAILDNLFRPDPKA